MRDHKKPGPYPDKRSGDRVFTNVPDFAARVARGDGDTITEGVARSA